MDVATGATKAAKSLRRFHALSDDSVAWRPNVHGVQEPLMHFMMPRTENTFVASAPEDAAKKLLGRLTEKKNADQPTRTKPRALYLYDPSRRRLYRYWGWMDETYHDRKGYSQQKGFERRGYVKSLKYIDLRPPGEPLHPGSRASAPHKPLPTIAPQVTPPKRSVPVPQRTVMNFTAAEIPPPVQVTPIPMVTSVRRGPVTMRGLLQ